jgi:hypothetical protein
LGLEPPCGLSLQEQTSASVDAFRLTTFLRSGLDPEFIFGAAMSHLVACVFCAPVATAMIWAGIVLYMNMVLPEEQD